jgi:hypothetical protein
MQYSKFYFGFLGCLLFLISSCSTTHQAYLRSIQLAFADSQDYVLESEKIRQSPFDLAYITKDELPSAVVALAYIDNGQYKWVSSDDVTFVEKNGRIIKTLSLRNNLDFVFSESIDPLSNANNISNGSRWQRAIDIDSRYFGVKLDSTFNVIGGKQLKIQDLSFDTVLIEESVVLAENTNHKFSDSHWVNQFWLHKESGRLLRSRQKVLPGGAYFDITYVSRALRL